MREVTGKTTVLGVIGDPISHSLSPTLHNLLAEAMGHDVVYVAFHVKPGNVSEAIQGAYALGIKGLNVTMPHKQEVVQELCKKSQEVDFAKAANTLVYTAEGYVGLNTDIEGLQKAMLANDIQWKDKHVAIIGAGGAGYAACLSVMATAKSISLYNRTKDKAESLKKNLEHLTKTDIKVYEIDEQPSVKPELVIQTTGVGMGSLKDQLPPCTKLLVTPDTQVVDLIYNPKETAFLSYAKAQGCKVMNGFDMLFYQGVMAYEQFTHEQLPEVVVSQVRQTLRNQLGL